MRARGQEAGVEVYRLDGDLDADRATDLREETAARIGTRRLVLDLTSVAFVDSAGLGALVGAVRRLREAGGQVVICCARGPVERVLRSAGLARVVPVVASLAEAVRVLGSDRPEAGAGVAGPGGVIPAA